MQTSFNNMIYYCSSIIHIYHVASLQLGQDQLTIVSSAIKWMYITNRSTTLQSQTSLSYPFKFFVLVPIQEMFVHNMSKLQSLISW